MVDESMDYTMKEVLQFVAENDVKFIRLAFCDIFGIQKNISIMPDELPRAFSEGISFDASAVRGFLNVEESDLFLRPDPRTLSVLPWRPSHGRVVRLYCDILTPDGQPFGGDGRAALRAAVKRAEDAGFSCQAGSECEFYLFELDDEGNPTDIPHDRAGYCDIAPKDNGENVRREICLTLEQMSIRPVSSHHEQGPGQNEIDFRYGPMLEAADNLVTFQSVVKTIAARSGLHATFMPKPLPQESGNGLHINLSLYRNGQNLFRIGNEHSPESESFIAGILRRVREITAFLNPVTNSYERFGSFEAPKYVSWSHQNRSQLIRIPPARDEHLRMELRSPDPVCNPYLAFALLLDAGMEGIRDKLPLCPPCNGGGHERHSAGREALPARLDEAVALARSSEFVRTSLPGILLEHYLDAKQEEYEQCLASVDPAEWEHDRYF